MDLQYYLCHGIKTDFFLKCLSPVCCPIHFVFQTNVFVTASNPNLFAAITFTNNAKPQRGLANLNISNFKLNEVSFKLGEKAFLSNFQINLVSVPLYLLCTSCSKTGE